MHRSSRWLTLCLASACTQAAPDPARDPAARPSAPSSAATRDSTWVEVRGPTLVAFWPVNAAAVLDSGGADVSALDDFGHYLSAADSGLRSLGVRVVNVGGRTLHLVSADGVTEFTVPPDSSDIGYYLVAPGRSPVVYYGVQMDDELLAAAREYTHGPRAQP
jgi:hypothetical protein